MYILYTTYVFIFGINNEDPAFFAVDEIGTKHLPNI
jgi:hypothetical protein